VARASSTVLEVKAVSAGVVHANCAGLRANPSEHLHKRPCRRVSAARAGSRQVPRLGCLESLEREAGVPSERNSRC
jgi:hypothetical protein